MYRGLSTRRGGLDAAVKAKLPIEIQQTMGRWESWVVQDYKEEEILRIANYTEECFAASFNADTACADVAQPTFNQLPQHLEPDSATDPTPSLQHPLHYLYIISEAPTPTNR